MIQPTDILFTAALFGLACLIVGLALRKQNKPENSIRTITLEIDIEDYDAIQNAITRHQVGHIVPHGDGNQAERRIADICRGWEEMLDIPLETREDDEDWI